MTRAKFENSDGFKRWLVSFRTATAFKVGCVPKAEVRGDQNNQSIESMLCSWR